MSVTTRHPRRRGRRLAGIAVTTGLLLVAAGGAAVGVLGLDTWQPGTDRSAPSPVSGPGAGPTGASRAEPTPEPTAEPTPEPSAEPSPQPARKPSPTAGSGSGSAAGPEPSRKPPPAPEPEPVLAPGDEGVEVRELQARLNQLAWFGYTTTGSYGPDTRTAVAGFQAKRGFEATGVVDERTWGRLVSMSVAPTDAQLFNRAGPALLSPGAEGPAVREVQARLRQIAWFFGDVSDLYGAQTEEAVRGFQAKRGIPATGAVDQLTLDLLEAMTLEPTADDLANREPEPEEVVPATGAPLDPRCLTGTVLCIDKSSQSLRYVVDGDVLTSVDVRFGSDELPTREGEFAVFAKSRDHVSSLYDTPMPFAMFFSGGQAVHYSPDFAANGYAGASHGCVNVRDYDAVAALFDQVSIGTPVVVYWS